MIQQMIQFAQDPYNYFGTHTVTTLQLCIIPTLIALAIGVVLGLLVSRQPVAAFLASNVTGLARAIPTLAFLAAVEPYLGFGFTPAAVALVLLGIPPILLNTVAGLRGVDPAAVDAARGMGMTRVQILLRVELPLALPVIAGGVRVAAVQIVATSPLAALIGAGGYGDYILQGLGDPSALPALLLGATLIAILALVTETSLAALQRVLTPRGLRVRAEVGGTVDEGATVTQASEPEQVPV